MIYQSIRKYSFVYRAITGKGVMSSPSGRGYGGYGTDKMDQRGTYQDHYRYEFLLCMFYSTI